MNDVVDGLNDGVGKIFSSLLEGYCASLCRVVQGSSMSKQVDFVPTGLFFKLTIGGELQGSIDGLSGGQKTLLSIAFLLALLVRCNVWYTLYNGHF
jgi:chromosome segregation ATPase